MRKIDYDVPAEKRWVPLLKSLKEKPLKERKKILKDATDYRSGEGMLNTVYMGALAIAGLKRELGGHFDSDLNKLIREASEEQINRGLKSAMHTVEYMLAHPVRNCPCCGQIVQLD